MCLDYDPGVADACRAPTEFILKKARQDAGNRMDVAWGGQRGSPKFPSSMPLRFLLRYARRSGDEQALWMVTHTLDKMAGGGMYDLIGGGFHRYSTDAHWLSTPSEASKPLCHQSEREGQERFLRTPEW